MKKNGRFENTFGAFSADANEYIISTPRTPKPWVNVVSNGDYGFVVSQTGSGYSWRTHAQLNRLTRWEQDLVKDEWGKYLFVRNRSTKDVWSVGWKPVCEEPDHYRCRHGFGYTAIESAYHGIESELLMFVPNDEPLELWMLSLTNKTRKKQSLSIVSYLEWCLGAAPDWHREFQKCFIETSYSDKLHAIEATKRLWEVPTQNGHWNTDWPYVAFHSVNVPPHSFDTDKESVLGAYGNLRDPESVTAGKLGKKTGKWVDPVASLRIDIALAPGATKEIVFTLGAADSKEEAGAMIKKYKNVQAVRASFEKVRTKWKTLLETPSIETPDPAMDTMLNKWLKYQSISGRLWGRSAYYQTGGAYGFRDQLQDSHIYLPINPQITWDQIRLHARHQFKDGTVYHWWHPLSEVGHVTPITDNLLWLPYVVRSYLDETAKFEMLREEEPFLDERNPCSLYNHCVLAIDKALTRLSDRGIPLIGAGDWNDGLSAVGLGMKGESVWLGHFLHKILVDFAEVAQRTGDDGRARRYREEASRLRNSVNSNCWDGDWYFRATKDSGEKIGSRTNREGSIFLNAQVWAIIGGVADEERSVKAMDAVEKRLEFKAGPVLLYPAYKTPDSKIGYLTRYAPGVRENGGVYTHAATWAVIAAAILKRGESAYRIFSKLNPILRGLNPEEYVAEPYVTAGNSDGPESPWYGRGGWTWYTGSAAWLHKAGMEWILGIRPSIDGLIVDPCIPKKWKKYTVQRKFRDAFYIITVKNPDGVGHCVKSLKIDGNDVQAVRKGDNVVLPVFPPGSQHEIEVSLGRIL